MNLMDVRALAASPWAELPLTRKPFLRRSLREDWLLTCSLPQVASPETVTAYGAAMQSQGWEVLASGDLLELCPPLVPPEVSLPTPDGRFLALSRLCSLLARHPGGQAERPFVLGLLKAEEMGAPALERLCQRLCRDCAQRLRLHTPLPGGVLPYATAILTRLEAKEDAL